MIRNEWGFPVPDKLEQAKAIADDARARNFPPPCDCAQCLNARNLEAVQRILAKWIDIGAE